MDWLPYLEFAAPLLPWRAAAKSVLTHTLSLFLGLSAFLVSQTINLSRRKAEGEAIMTKPMLDDYAIAHPFMLPLWLWAFLYLFINSAPVSGFIIILLFAFWLRQWLQSLTLILEFHSRETATGDNKEGLPCTEFVRT